MCVTSHSYSCVLTNLECYLGSPPPIRGALVMMWQTWTAFGIMLGFVADLAFYHVKDTHNITGLNWRLMLGSVSEIWLFQKMRHLIPVLGRLPRVIHRGPSLFLPGIPSLVYQQRPLSRCIYVSSKTASQPRAGRPRPVLHSRPPRGREADRTQA